MTAPHATSSARAFALIQLMVIAATAYHDIDSCRQCAIERLLCTAQLSRKLDQVKPAEEVRHEHGEAEPADHRAGAGRAQGRRADRLPHRLYDADGAAARPARGP